MQVVAAPDKFRGSASAAEVASAIGRGVRAHEGKCVEIPVADGGEGTLDVLGGANRTSLVSDPMGDPIDAAWRLSGDLAVIEMARASGLELVGGAEGNDAMAASTAGTGELIAAAVDAGAKRIIIGVGGSATTDGGLGAIRALVSLPRLRGVQIDVACDVRTRFVDAARVFAPQKGASPAEVKLLTRRLERLAQVYLEDHGFDVESLDRSGAAGGLAGGLAAIGATLMDGFALVADEVELDAAIEGADLVITGEGHLDAPSFDGKVIGGVAEMASRAGVRVVAVVGGADAEVDGRIETINLTERFGLEAAIADPLGSIERAVGDWLAVEYLTRDN